MYENKKKNMCLNVSMKPFFKGKIKTNRKCYICSQNCSCKNGD